LKLRSRAQRILLAGVLLCLAALLIEVTYRFYLFGFAALSYDKVDSVAGIGRAGVLRSSTYLDILYELIPNQDRLFDLVRLRTNSEGLADEEYATAKPANTFRIVLLGSSYSMPVGVPLEQSWQQDLEGRLNGLHDGRRYEVINFSVGGYDPIQLLGVLKHKAMTYDPNLIVVDVTLSSAPLIRPEEVYRHPFVVQPRTHPFWHSFALESLGDSLWNLSLTLRRAVHELRYPGGPPPLPQPSAKFLQSLDDLRSYAADHDRRLCFVILQHDRRLVLQTAELRAEVKRGGGCVIDTFPGFRDEPYADLTILTIDPHPNTRAQAIFAQEVFAFLVAHRILEGDGQAKLQR